MTAEEAHDALDQPIRVPNSPEPDNTEPEQKPKRRRGRPAKLTVSGETAEPKRVKIEEPEEPEEKTPRRRGAVRSRVTPEQVTRVTVASFQMVAALRHRAYWQVAPEETYEWNAAAAELLNSLSPSVAKQLAKASNGFTVALGLGGIILARSMQEADEARQRRDMAAGMAQFATAEGQPVDGETLTPEQMISLYQSMMGAA